MKFETRNVLAVAAVIVATGVTGVEATRAPAQAAMPASQTVDYARARVDAAFSVANSTPAKTITIAAARKGDKLAVQTSSAAPKVVAKHTGPSTTQLTRTGEYTLAQF